MKLKIKSLAVAVALAATGVAHAAIDNGYVTGDGELFLTVWDDTTGHEASFNMGLDINMSTFDGNGTYTFSNIFSNPVFTANFDSTNLAEMSSWKWSVTGVSGNQATQFLDERVVFTEANASGFFVNNGAVQGSATSVGDYQSSLGSCDSCGVHTTATVPATGDPKYAGTFYGNNFKGQMNINNTGSIGDSLYFFYAENNILNDPDFNPDNAAILNQYAYQWSLDSLGNLIYNPTDVGAPVPVPAAVWLLGSALAGLVGVARRRDGQSLTA